jgi:hypothetical protein
LSEKAGEQDFKDLHALLAEGADASKEDILTFLKESLTMERLVWGHCPNCHKKVKVDYPDYNGAVKLLSLWLERGHGKVGSGGPGKQAAGLEAPKLGKPLEKMSAAEREAYAAMLVARHPELAEEFTIIKQEAVDAAVAQTEGVQK